VLDSLDELAAAEDIGGLSFFGSFLGFSFEERKRPSKEKPRKEPKKLRPPISSGCFHICDTLIFEVYKLLGGGICDC